MNGMSSSMHAHAPAHPAGARCQASCFLLAAKADEPAASGREASGSGARAEARAKAADAKKAAEPKAGREVDRPASRWAAYFRIALVRGSVVVAKGVKVCWTFW